MLMFLAGLTCGLCVGHVLSPWIDGKMVDLAEWLDPDLKEQKEFEDWKT
jgi:hypothetical protein